MLEDIALDTIYKYNLIEENDHIIVGVSGGADSISLLYFLHTIKDKLKFNITTVHINHGMRGDDALGDENFVCDFCKMYNIDFLSFKFDIEKTANDEKISTEEAGRKYRYIFFNKALNDKKANKIATAHNKNDNAETVLMNLFRGAMLGGLSGMSPMRDNIIRPLLNCDRGIIEKYCSDNNIAFRHDYTNDMDIYTRNKIRLKLIPYIIDNFNQNIINSLCTTAYNIKEEDAFLNKLTKEYFDKCLIDKNKFNICFDIKKLTALDDVLRRRIIRYALSIINGNLKNISHEHILSILSILDKNTGKSINLPNKIIVYTQYNLFYISKNNNENSKVTYEYKLKKDTVVFIKEINKYALLTKKNKNNDFSLQKVCTIALNYGRIDDSLILRQRIAGDTISINNMTKKIKNIFIDKKIPSNNRDFYPIMLHNDTIIGIFGVVTADKYLPKDKNNIIYLYIWEKNCDE